VSVDGFSRVIDLLPEPTLIVTGGGVVLAANPAAADRLGLVPAEVAGRRLCDLAADPPADVAAYLRSCARSGQRVIGSVELTAGGRHRCRAEGAVLRPRAGEEEALVLLRLAPHEESAGRFVLLNQRIDELNREVTRRRRAEEELRAQREWLRVTLTSIGDAVIATDTAGVVTFLNPRAEALTGWPRAEALGRPLAEVFPIVNEQTRAAVENPVARVLATGEVVGLANHTVLIARDGAETAIEDTAAPIREPGGELRGVVLVFHDVGDRRALERQLRERAERLAEADRRKDEFLAMLAHELRNPLAPVRNALTVLRLRHDPETVGQARDLMERQIGHLVRMVDDLLDVSRITRGKIALRAEPLDLARAARLAADDHRPRAEAAGLTLAADLPDGPVWVSADPTRIAQVVGNLLENAVKFSDPGGAITLRVAALPDGQAELTVRDTGTGIDPVVLPHVFEPFAQADRTLDRSRGGLGLGLATVKGLVELHGGSVRAASGGPGRGTELTVRLPGLTAPGGPAAPAAAAPPPARRLRVLVVDDNRDAAESLRMLLDLTGYEAGVAHTGPDGVAAARRSRPDVVLCDIGLPGMDGFAVAAALRGDPDTAAARLVAVTGYGGEAVRRRALAAGFDEHLVKPVEPAALFAALTAG
jgi:PAS domain S-box-containing protein